MQLGMQQLYNRMCTKLPAASVTALSVLITDWH
jgi:hypothetical protein